MHPVDDLLEWDVETLLCHLQSLMTEPTQFLSPDAWAYFAQGAATKSGLARGRSNQQALKWSRVAVLAYERAALSFDIPRWEREQHEISAMWIRVWAIQEFGANEDDGVLNPQILNDWFQQRLPRPFLEVQPGEKANLLLTIENQMELHNFNQRVQVLAPLVAHNVFPDSSIVTEWVRHATALGDGA